MQCAGVVIFQNEMRSVPRARIGRAKKGDSNEANARHDVRSV
jgi:hypothetical protein